MKPQSNLFLRLFILSCIYSAIAILYTWPLLTSIDSAYIGPATAGDAPGNIWNIFIFKNNFFNNENLFFTHKIYSPIGTSLIMHGYIPGMSVFTLLFKNSILGMNIYLLMHFVLSAVGAFSLAYKLSKNTFLSFLTGFIFSFSAYKMLRLNEHYMLVLTATIPFYIISFINAFDFSVGRFWPKITSRRYFIFLFLLIFITAIHDYYSTFYLLYFSVIWLSYYKLIFYWNKYPSKIRWSALIVFLVIMHFIVEGIYHKGVDNKGGIWWGGDFAAFFVPNANSWLWDRTFFENIIPSIFTHGTNMEFQLFLGYSVILMLVVIVVSIFKNKLSIETGRWLFALLICFMLAMPTFKIAGIRIFYTPTAIIHFIPFFNNIRCNTRIEVLINLFIPLIFALIAAPIFNNRRNNKLLISLGAVFLIFMFADLKPKNYNLISERKIPAIFDTLKNTKGQTVLSIPVGIGDGIKHYGSFNTMELFYQTYHQKNMCSGYISRMSPEIKNTYLSDTIMSTLLYLSENDSIATYKATEKEKDIFFKTFRPDFILIHPTVRSASIETYVNELIERKKYAEVCKDGYRLIIFK